MKATELKLIDFLRKQETQFVIPVYQRNYDWDIKQCKKLLEDIEKVANQGENDTHFIGSIVFIQKGVYSSGINQLSIIDGQQRLTTITLLWLAIYHKALEVGESRLAEKIRNMYLINQYLEGEAKIKLKPTENNALALAKLLTDRIDLNSLDEKINIHKNFKYFYLKLLQLDTNFDFDFIERGISKLIFVEISLEQGKDDPQKIFESLNSTGLALNNADLIRNYILMNLDHRVQEKIYKEYWLPIEELTLNINTNEQELSEFIRHFLSFKTREVPNKAKVYEKFKETYKNIDENSLEILLQELKNYANYYNTLINPSKERNKKIAQQIGYINKLEISVSYPFLLQVYHDYAKQHITEEVFIQVLELIQSFAWRRFICSLPTNALNKIFLRLYSAIKSPRSYLIDLQKYLIKLSGVQRFPNNVEVEKELEYKDLYNIHPKNRMYLLTRLENHDNNEPVQIEGNDKITIEHIFPQNPADTWKEALSKEAYKLFKEKYLNTLANLTLSGNNSALGNKGFIEKRDMPEKGYKDSKLFLNKFLSQQNDWNLEIMRERFKHLLDRFKAVWNYPEVSFTEKETKEFNILDLEDPTHENIDYIVLQGETYHIRTFKSMLEIISKRLFELNKEHFLRLNNKLKITFNANNLRVPIQVGERYFIEGGLSAKNILKKVKILLTHFDMQHDCTIKLQDNANLSG